MVWTAFAVPCAVSSNRQAELELSTTRSTCDRPKSQAPPIRRRKRGTTPGLIQSRRDARDKRSSSNYMLTAKWGGVTLAESSDYEFIDGRFYFPKASVRWEFLANAGLTKTLNPIGTATYYDIVVPSNNGRSMRNRGAAWSFVNLKKQWAIMEGRTTFWKGVTVSTKPRDLSPPEEPRTS